MPLVTNQARQKFVTHFVCGLIRSKKVQFSAIAAHFNDQRSNESNERRIQAFFKDVQLNYDQVALLLCLFVPRGKLVLCLDRTEWDFGKCQVNILMLTARFGQVAVPLYWELLDNKSGNSSVNDRWQILEKLICLVGKDRIGMLIADREFVGKEWIGKLARADVAFCLRLPKHHLLTLRNGDIVSVEQLLERKQERYYQQVLVDGHWVNVYMKSLPKGDILFLIGSMAAKELGLIYRRRWSIEVLFQSMKKRGFDLEATHLRCLQKIKKLIALVAIAFAFSLLAGKHYHQKVKKIKIKKHGYKANSFFRKGLDLLKDYLNNKPIANEQFWDQALDRFYQWSRVRLLYLKI